MSLHFEIYNSCYTCCLLSTSRPKAPLVVALVVALASMSSGSSGVTGVQELRELVLVREDELKFAQWKLDDAKKRLQEAEGLEWAWELETAMKTQESAASPMVEAVDHQTPKASMPCQTNVINAESLVAAAQRFDLHGQPNKEDSLGETNAAEDKGEWPSNLPVPPPPPPLDSVQTMCPHKCKCGAPCTRIEQMLERQHAGHPFARTRLKHFNHTCSTCQATWYQNGGNKNVSRKRGWA